MVGQISYPTATVVASAGLKADCGPDNVLSMRAYEDIVMGSAVSKVVGVDYQVRLPAQNLATIVLDADLVTSNSIAVSVNGSALTPIVYATSHDATMTAIAAAIQAETGIATAVVGDANNRTITVIADQDAVAFIDSFVVTLGASQATATITNTSADGLYGVALREQSHMNLYSRTGSNGPAPYYEGDAVSMMSQGRVWVYVEDTITSDSDVYVRFKANGANTVLGTFRSDDDSGTAFLVSNCVWRVGGSAGGLAVLEINNPN